VKSLREDFSNTWWQTFEESNCIPGIAISARSMFFKLTDQEKWHEVNTIYDDEKMTPFGNMIAYMMAGLDSCLKMYTNHKLFLTCMGAHLNSFYYGVKLHPNILVTGEKESGKSRTFQLIQECSFDNSTLSASHITQQAHNTKAFPGDLDFNDRTLIQEEAKNSNMGSDNRGNAIAADALLKNRLTSGHTVTMAFQNDKDGNRTMAYIVKRCSFTEIWASNEQNLHALGALGSRFLQIPCNQKVREDIKSEDYESQLKSQMNDDIDKHYAAFWKKLTLYVWIYAKHIEAGILPEIDTSGFKIVSKIIFQSLENAGVPRPGIRKIQMAEQLAISFQMMYNVYLAFFSELSSLEREDDMGEIRPFDHKKMFASLGAYGVITKEVAVWTLSLLVDQWLEELKYTVLDNIAFVSGSWPTSEKTHYHVDNDGEVHYIKVKISSDTLTTVRDYIKTEKPSLNEIQSVIESAKKDYVDSHPRTLVDDTLTLKIELFRQFRKAAGCEPIDLDKMRIPTDEKKLIEMADKYMEISDNDKENDIGTKVVTQLAVSSRSILTKIAGRDTKRIPLLKEEWEEVFGKKDKVKYYYLSIEGLEKKFDGLFANALNELCHKGAREAKLMTGITYKHQFDDKHVGFLYQVFQPFNIVDKGRPLLLLNRTAMRREQHASLCNMSSSKLNEGSVLMRYQKYENLPLAQRTTHIVIEGDIDEDHFKQHCLENGYSWLDCMHVIPTVAKTKIIEIRKNNPIYRETNDLLLEEYPKSLIEGIINQLHEESKTKLIKSLSIKHNLNIDQTNALQAMTYTEVKKLTDDDVKNVHVGGSLPDTYVPYSHFPTARYGNVIRSVAIEELRAEKRIIDSFVPTKIRKSIPLSKNTDKAPVQKRRKVSSDDEDVRMGRGSDYE
jgi:uncharacterized protein YeeX (DUF496 family)